MNLFIFFVKLIEITFGREVSNGIWTDASQRELLKTHRWVFNSEVTRRGRPEKRRGGGGVEPPCDDRQKQWNTEDFGF